MNIFEQDNFSIKYYIEKSNNIEKLDKISEYINFALKTTILKQNPIQNLESQKDCCKRLLLNFINGDTQSFTRIANIRNNINQINKGSIIDLLIKSSIELDCYNRNIIKLLENNLCSRITNEIYIGNYVEILETISNNSDMLKNLINNYIELTYEKDNIFNDKKKRMCTTDSLTNSALIQLNLSMIYVQKEIIGIKK